MSLILTQLPCAIGEHSGHFTVHVVALSNGKRTTACAEHLGDASAAIAAKMAGADKSAPAHPNSDASTVVAADASKARPVGARALRAIDHDRSRSMT